MHKLELTDLAAHHWTLIEECSLKLSDLILFPKRGWKRENIIHILVELKKLQYVLEEAMLNGK